MAVSTLLVLAALLGVQLEAVERGLRGIAIAACVVSALVVVAYVPPSLAAGGLLGALVGLVVYVGLVALLRPRGLRESWSYLRALR